MNQSPQEQSPSRPLVSEDEEVAYALWLFGEDDLTDAQRQAFETRYQKDDVPREETDELRAIVNIVCQNVEPSPTLMEPPRRAQNARQCVAL